MKIIVKFSPEIIIKSYSVRIFFVKMLIKNIRMIMNHRNKIISILRFWDYLEINCINNDYIQVIKVLINIPGIHHILLVKDSIIYSLLDIYYQIVLTNNCLPLSGKTFCIRVKRYGNHVFNSQEIACYLGSKVCNNIDNVHVNLSNPDKTIYLEIKNNKLYLIIERYKGLGGFPIGTQQNSLSLISGGFDSAVASYMLMRRGCKIHYCFFNLIEENFVSHSNIEVYKIAYYLWNKFSCSNEIKFVSVNFSDVVKEISVKIKNNYTGIVLKRMMIRAACMVASNLKIKSLVTGEVLGQVSSQTLDNLTLINDVVSPNYVILRPLIVYDKESIIKLSRQIGTEVFSKIVPEYCGIVSKKATAQAKKEYIKFAENHFDTIILDKAVSQAHIMNMCDIPKLIINSNSFLIETTTQLNSKDVILDIRTRDEQKKYPLQLPEYIQVHNIPFYKLIDQFHKLDQNKVYLLYCNKGVMSRLQAIHLYHKGFKNVKIYRFSLN